jgi:5-methylthioribose kinase
VSRQLQLSESSLPDYLRRIGLFDACAEIRVEKAGDGNINWVRRASAPGVRSLVVKQARPALERFPEYQVDTERLIFEARYLEAVRPFDTSRICPAVHGFQEADRVLVLEDLGAAERLDHMLARGGDATPAAEALGAFLGRVHHGTWRDPGLAARFANHAMQRLHGEHIFVLPLAANDFPLPPRLRERAVALAADAELRRIAAACYARYLTPEGSLLHGDVQAGNVLLAERGPVLLDAEIAHVGDPAFDVGTLLAHLALPAIARGEPRRAAPAANAAWRAWSDAFAEDARPPFASAARYAGLEMLRRTIGAARVAPVEEDEAGLRVLDAAVGWIRTPPAEPGALL